MSDIVIKESGDYETRSGLPVEILKTDVVDSNGFCVVGVITNKTGFQSVQSWLPDGKFNKLFESDLDLVKKQLWIETYSYASSRGLLVRKHKTHDDAISLINVSFAASKEYILVSLTKEGD